MSFFFFTGVVLILFGLQNVSMTKTLHTAGYISIFLGIVSTILMFYILLNVGKRMTEISMVLTRESTGFSECFFADADEISEMARHVIALLHQKDLLEISERRADASAKSMESLITHASVPICEITRDGRMLNMNIMASQLFGELERWQNNSVYHKLITENSQQDVLLAFRSALHGDVVPTFHCSMYGVRGEIREAMMTASPRYDAQGKIFPLYLSPRTLLR